MNTNNKANRYAAILESVFFQHYRRGVTEFTFDREEIEQSAKSIGIKLPKNLGDLLYSFRFRTPLPDSITKTAEVGRDWVIELAGRAKYAFRQRVVNRIVPSDKAYRIKIPDATPEIITMYAKSDEQALLAKVRYNRLIDIFLRLTAHSLQSHLRTTVQGIGQIEVDELYVGIRNTGQQFIIPVQAKGGNDQIGAAQVMQDLKMCRQNYPALTPRLIAVQFITSDVIAMFELVFQGEELRIVDEKHYQLVAGAEISDGDLQTMSRLSD
jgi:hypothetical protein